MKVIIKKMAKAKVKKFVADLQEDQPKLKIEVGEDIIITGVPKNKVKQLTEGILYVSPKCSVVTEEEPKVEKAKKESTAPVAEKPATKEKKATKATAKETPAEKPTKKTKATSKKEVAQADTAVAAKLTEASPITQEIRLEVAKKYGTSMYYVEQYERNHSIKTIGDALKSSIPTKAKDILRTMLK